MKRVFICHPFQNKKENLEKTKLYCLLALEEHYNPISPALYYSQLLDDGDVNERKLGQICGLDILETCSELWICGNEITEGMSKEIEECYKINQTQSDILIRHRVIK
jgi:hypothetical protein